MHSGVCGQQSLQRRQHLLPQALCKRRVDKHDVKGALCDIEPLQRIGMNDIDLIGMQAVLGLLKISHQRAIALEHRHVRSPARCRLESQRAATCEQVKTARPRQPRLQPVEQRLAYPLRGRPQTGHIGDIKARIAPTAGNDANLAWWLRSHRAWTACGANMPVFSRICDPMFGFIKKTKPAPPAEALPVEPESTAAGAQGWRERLRDSGMARGLSSLFARNPRLDESLLDDIETTLLLADVGVLATQTLVATLREGLKSRAYADVAALRLALRRQLVALLEPVSKPLSIEGGHRPFVILMVGINGAGKTTTIGKLAHRMKDEGRRVMLAAGDTFRAAAVEQLKVWGARNDIPVTAQTHGADPAAVIFDALQAAKARDIDVLIADTAGRLHTQSGLMAELGKVRRVLGKLDDSAPHEVLMVIDGTTGQNAVSQLRQFQQAIGVTGLVISKLDGSAKGGVVFALAREFGLPVRFIGLGERMEDLRPFDAESFVDGLLPETLGEP